MKPETDTATMKELADRNVRRCVIFLAVFMAVGAVWLIVKFLAGALPHSDSAAIRFAIFSCGINACLLILVHLFGNRNPEFSVSVVIAWTAASRLYQVVLSGFSTTAVMTFLILFSILAMILSSPRIILAMAAVVQGVFGILLLMYPPAGQDGLGLFLLTTLLMMTVSIWNWNSTKDHLAQRLAKIDLEEKNVTLREATLRLDKALAVRDRAVAIRELILRLNYLLVEHLPLEKYLAAMLDDVVRTLGHKGPACILLCDAEGRKLKVVAPIRYDPVKAEGYFIDMKDTFQYRETGGNYTKTIIIRHISRFIGPGATPILDRIDGSVVDCSLSSPIFIDGKLYGIINLDSPDNDAFDDEDVEIMDYIRTQVATVLRHFDLLERIDKLSRYDQLTGFHNRWMLEDFARFVESACQENGGRLAKDGCIAERDGSGHLLASESESVWNPPLSLVMIDIDGLKQINDSFGHAAGDRTIILFSQAIRFVTGGEDKVIRMGGDEFLVIFPGKDGKAASAAMKEALLSMQVEERDIDRIGACNREGHPEAGFPENPKSLSDLSDLMRMSVSFSFGIAQAGIDAADFDSLITVADRRLYDAKTARGARR